MRALCQDFDIPVETVPTTSAADKVLIAGATRITSYFKPAPSASGGQQGPCEPASQDEPADPLTTLASAADSQSADQQSPDRPHDGFQAFPDIDPAFRRVFENSQSCYENSQSYFGNRTS